MAKEKTRTKIDELLERADRSNDVEPVNLKEIAQVEERMRIKFPKVLRWFWEKHGYAFLRQGFQNDVPVENNNRILDALEIESLLNKSNDCGFMAPSEGFGENCIPFFHLGEATYFVVSLDSPNPVYGIVRKKKLTESLAEFFDAIADDAGSFT